MQVILTLKALGVNLVNLFGARRTRRKPSALRDHLDSTDSRSIAWCNSQSLENFLAREFARIQFFRRELFQNVFLRERRGRIDTFVRWLTERFRQVIVDRAGIAPFARGHLRSKQAEDETVLVGGPNGSVGAQK